MATDPPLEELLQAVRDLVVIGGRTAAGFFGRVSMSRKSDDTPVTQADHAVQEVILAALAQRYPAHAVLCEEPIARPQRHAAAAAEYCWVVDPIDGTRNFGRGARLYSTAVAVLHNGRPVAGAIHDAAGGETYSASLGCGAFRDAQRLRLTDRATDYNTTLAIGSFRRRPIPPVVRGWMDQYLYRNLGSLCLHLALVAAGCLDAAYAVECKLWDVAAGALLIEEAGGIVTGHLGRPLWPMDMAAYRNADMPVLAGTVSMHRRLLADLQATGERA